MRLTLLIAATHDFSVLGPAMRAIQALQRLEEVEALFLCSSIAEFQAPDEWDWAPFRVVEVGANLPVHKLRSLGVEEAKGDYVALLEDHAVLGPDWLDHILPRLSEKWGAIGPSIIAASQSGPVVQAVFLLTYGEWAGRTEGTAVDHISGHNSVYKRDLLVNSSDLDMEMACPTLLQRRIRQEGFKIWYEPGAVVHHWDPSTLSGACLILLALGEALGLARTRNWPSIFQKLYPLALPLIHLKHWWRAAAQFPRVRKTSNFRMDSLLVAWGLAGLWATGEAIGSLRRDPKAYDRLSEMEVNRWRFVHPEELPWHDR